MNSSDLLSKKINCVIASRAYACKGLPCPDGNKGATGPTGATGATGLPGPVSFYIFDGGSSINNYTNGPAFDCGTSN
jgi:hypothetical protein